MKSPDEIAGELLSDNGEYTQSLVAEAINAAQIEAWNEAVIASAKKLEDAMAAQSFLKLFLEPQAFEETQTWGKCMVFAIKDLLFTVK